MNDRLREKFETWALAKGWTKEDLETRVTEGGSFKGIYRHMQLQMEFDHWYEIYCIAIEVVAQAVECGSADAVRELAK